MWCIHQGLIYSWLRGPGKGGLPDSEVQYKFDYFIPLDSTKKPEAVGFSEGQGCKRAFNYAYGFNVHYFVGHLQLFIQAAQPFETTNSFGAKVQKLLAVGDSLFCSIM